MWIWMKLLLLLQCKSRLIVQKIESARNVIKFLSLLPQALQMLLSYYDWWASNSTAIDRLCILFENLLFCHTQLTVISCCLMPAKKFSIQPGSFYDGFAGYSSTNISSAAACFEGKQIQCIQIPFTSPSGNALKKRQTADSLTNELSFSLFRFKLHWVSYVFFALHVIVAL